MCIQFVWSGSAPRITLSNGHRFICSFSLAASLAAIRGSICHFSRFATGSEERRTTSNASEPRVCVSAWMCECGLTINSILWQNDAPSRTIVNGTRTRERRHDLCAFQPRLMFVLAAASARAPDERKGNTNATMHCQREQNQKYMYTKTYQLNVHVACTSHNEYSVCMAFRLSSIEKNTHSMFAFVFSLFGLVGSNSSDGIRSVRYTYLHIHIRMQTIGCRCSTEWMPWLWWIMWTEITQSTSHPDGAAGRAAI